MSDHTQSVAANLLARPLEADRPDQRWVGDITELLVGEHGAKLYLAALLGSTRASSPSRNDLPTPSVARTK